jgi:hypothetical protein
MMEAPIVEYIDWHLARARLARLEEAHGRLRSRGLLALRLNILVIVGIALWLAWPGKTLTAERLTTDTIGADIVWSGYTLLDRESALITGRYREIPEDRIYREAWIALRYSDSRDPRLYLRNDRSGEIEATIYGAPALRMFADTSSKSHEAGPQFEFRFGKEWSPEIVLRDVHGQVVWRAP